MNDRLLTASFLNRALLRQNLHDDELIAQILRKRRLARWALNGGIAVLLLSSVMGFLVQTGRFSLQDLTQVRPTESHVQTAVESTPSPAPSAQTLVEPTSTPAPLPITGDPTNEYLHLRMQKSLQTP